MAMLTFFANIALSQSVMIKEFSADTTLTDNSDEKVPTQKAVKTYIDNVLPEGGSAGQFLQTDGSGTLSWASATSSGTVTEIDDLTDAASDGSSVFLGAGAGVNDDGSANDNTALGIDALASNSDGFGNTAVGKEALTSNTSGGANTALGGGALGSNLTGARNVAVGAGALASNTNGGQNIAVGVSPLIYNSTGWNNIAIGYESMYNNNSGSENVSIGNSAGYNSSGSNNVFIGSFAGYDETGSNKLYIESSSSTIPLIYGDFSSDKLVFNGSATVTGTLNISNAYTLPNTDGGNGEFLKTDGSGGVSWASSTTSSAFWTISSNPADIIKLSGGTRGIGSYDAFFYGSNANTHVNFGFGVGPDESFTGSSGQNYSYITVGGGYKNAARTDYATVSGGYDNNAEGTYSTIAGGEQNYTFGSRSAIVGGYNNWTKEQYNFIGGGANHETDGAYSAIVGGDDNTISLSSDYSFIGGGATNSASGGWTAICGGSNNSVSSGWDFVGGGDNNSASGGWSLVGGGTGNAATGSWSAVLGGGSNTASGSAGAIVGGEDNVAAGNYSSIGGGYQNTASGQRSAIPGGSYLKVGDRSFGFRGGIGGNPTSETDVSSANETFHIIDAHFWFNYSNANADFRVDGSSDYLFVADADVSRVGINRIPTTNTFEVGGDASKTSAGDWLSNSDKRIKRDVRDIAGSLETLMKLRPVTFRYTAEYLAKHPEINDKVYYNFIAQEYAEVFPESVKGSGEYLDSGEEILQLDAYNSQIVTIKAVQQLVEENRALKARLEKIEKMLLKMQISQDSANK